MPQFFAGNIFVCAAEPGNSGAVLHAQQTARRGRPPKAKGVNAINLLVTAYLANSSTAVAQRSECPVGRAERQDTHELLTSGDHGSMNTATSIVRPVPPQPITQPKKRGRPKKNPGVKTYQTQAKKSLVQESPAKKQGRLEAVVDMYPMDTRTSRRLPLQPIVPLLSHPLPQTDGTCKRNLLTSPIINRFQLYVR